MKRLQTIGSSILGICVALIMVLVTACNDQDEPALNPTIINPSFNLGTIKPWENITDSTGGVDWSYDQEQQAVKAVGLNQSNILMQGDFPPGQYTIEVTVTNNNPITTGSTNGVIRLYFIDQYGLHELDYTYLSPGEMTRQYRFTLPHNFNLIGFRVGRLGDGELNMAVSEFKIINFNR